MPQPVTDFINATDSLVDFAVARLARSAHWTVCKLPSMHPADLLQAVSGLNLPALTVTHLSSDFGNLPRRTASLSVVVCVDAFARDAEFTARDLCDEAISLLDDQVYESAHYRIRSYRAIVVDPGVAAHELLFEVRDH